MEILGAVICDDIRREDNGKLMLVGVYPEGIASASLPLRMNLGVLLLVSFDGKGKVETEIELSVPGTGEPVKIASDVEIGDGSKPSRTQTLVINGIPLYVTEAGEVKISSRQKDKEWKVIRSFPVTLAETNPVIPHFSSIEQRPPSEK